MAAGLARSGDDEAVAVGQRGEARGGHELLGVLISAVQEHHQRDRRGPSVAGGEVDVVGPRPSGSAVAGAEPASAHRPGGAGPGHSGAARRSGHRKAERSGLGRAGSGSPLARRSRQERQEGQRGPLAARGPTGTTCHLPSAATRLGPPLPSRADDPEMWTAPTAGGEREVEVAVRHDWTLRIVTGLLLLTVRVRSAHPTRAELEETYAIHTARQAWIEPRQVLRRPPADRRDPQPRAAAEPQASRP